MSTEPEIYIVGFNIDKSSAFQMAKLPLKTGVYRVAHGIYFVAKEPTEAVFRSLFNEYALRIAKHLFPDSGLTHSTAYYVRPINDQVFLGGAYSYRKGLAEGIGKFTFVQSPISINRNKRDKESVLKVLDDPELFEVIHVQDSLGSFEMRAQTPELMLLTQFENIKEYKSKLLVPMELDSLFEMLLIKHEGRGPLFDYLSSLSDRIGKDGEFARLYQRYSVSI